MRILALSLFVWLAMCDPFRVRFYFYEEETRKSGRLSTKESKWRNGDFKDCGSFSKHVVLRDDKTKARYNIHESECEWITTKWRKERRLKCVQSRFKWIIFGKRSSKRLSEVAFRNCNILFQNMQDILDSSYREAGFVKGADGRWEWPGGLAVPEETEDDSESDGTTEERYPGFDWDNVRGFDEDAEAGKKLEIIPPPIGLSKASSTFGTIQKNVPLSVPPESPSTKSDPSHLQTRVGISQRSHSPESTLWTIMIATIFFTLGYTFKSLSKLCSNKKLQIASEFLLAEEI